METTSASLPLPTSSRLPPAGQDSSEINDFQGWSSSRYQCGLVGHDNVNGGTPRRFAVDSDGLKTSTLPISTCQEEIIAPLGFEPEGSVSAFPFYEKWFSDFDLVLENEESRRVFRQYLHLEHHAALLDCWLSCQKFKLSNPAENTFSRSVKDFYRRYFQNQDYVLPISPESKENIVREMRHHSLTAFKLIGDQLYAQLYELFQCFLKSEFFANFCESYHHQLDRSNPKLLVDEGYCQYDRIPRSFPASAARMQENLSEFVTAQGSDAVTNPIKRGVCQHELHCDSPARTSLPSQRHNNFPSEGHSDRMTRSRDFCTESDRFSGTGNASSGFDHGKTQREVLTSVLNGPSGKDGLPDIPDFKPRTQKLAKEGMKPMRPEEFMKILLPKLERVLAEREWEEKTSGSCRGQDGNAPRKEENSCGDSSDTVVSMPHSSREAGSLCYGASSYASYDRYSVTGMSVTSGGSDVAWRDSHLKYKHGAKELASAVQHALRTELRECRCPNCLSHHVTDGRHVYGKQYVYPKSWHGHDCQSEYGSSIASKACSACRHRHVHEGHRTACSEHHPLTSSNLEQLDEPPFHSLADHTRILEWMERNEKFGVDELGNNPTADLQTHFRGSHRRHRLPVRYDTSRPGEGSGHHIGNQPIASDLGMPPLPQPDTSTVLEEAKRRLEDNSRGKTSKLRHKTQSRQSTHSKIHCTTHFDPSMSEKALSTTSGNWSASDSASLVSRQVPSVTSSSIPSSASKMWHESKSDLRSEAPTAKSHGSGSSKGRHKGGTVITYFFAHEPIPYRTNLPEKEIHLSQFKSLLTKKGSFRYFFKTTSEDDGEMVYQEVKDDHDILPMYEGTIVGKVEKVE